MKNEEKIRKKFRELLERVGRKTGSPYPKDIEYLFFYFFIEGIKLNEKKE